MSDDQALRKHLVQLLREGQAHLTLADAVKGFPIDKAGVRPGSSPHSAWELLEHIRIAQEDIALFSGVLNLPSRSRDTRENPVDYKALKWPEEYWPKSPAPGSAEEWRKSVAAIEENLAAFIQMLENPENNLFKPFPWGGGQTLLREALLIADHNAYHVGQLVLVRKMLEQDQKKQS